MTQSGTYVLSGDILDDFGQGFTAASGTDDLAYRWRASSGYRSDGDGLWTGSYNEPLVKVEARYYIPSMGVFITRDTDLGQRPYEYCNADPVNNVDPSGHDSTPGIKYKRNPDGTITATETTTLPDGTVCTQTETIWQDGHVTPGTWTVTNQPTVNQDTEDNGAFNMGFGGAVAGAGGVMAVGGAIGLGAVAVVAAPYVVAVGGVIAIAGFFQWIAGMSGPPEKPSPGVLSR